jgi:hypothetical protein
VVKLHAFTLSLRLFNDIASSTNKRTSAYFLAIFLLFLLWDETDF